jgi:hypothetical protein
MPVFLVALAFGGLLGWVALDSKQRKDVEEGHLRALRQKVQEIAALWSATPPVVIFDETVSNAEARGDGRIYVNRAWFTQTCVDSCGMDDAVCARAFAYWLLTHEVAHVIFRDPRAYAALEIHVPPWIRQYHRHARELRADWYAGRALAHFGEDVGIINRILPRIAPQMTASDTHPALHDRIRAATAGYWFEVRLAPA